MNFRRLLALVFLVAWLFSGSCFSHSGIGNQQFHQYEDVYFAAKKRAEEAKTGRVEYKHGRFSAKQRSSMVLAADNPAVYGEWGKLTVWPFAFASAANLPDGRILAWGGNNKFTFSGGTYTHAAIWDPANDQILEVDNPSHSMFCGIPVMLAQ